MYIAVNLDVLLAFCFYCNFLVLRQSLQSIREHTKAVNTQQQANHPLKSLPLTTTFLLLLHSILRDLYVPIYYTTRAPWPDQLLEASPNDKLRRSQLHLRLHRHQARPSDQLPLRVGLPKSPRKSTGIRWRKWGDLPRKLRRPRCNRTEV